MIATATATARLMNGTSLIPPRPVAKASLVAASSRTLRTIARRRSQSLARAGRHMPTNYHVLHTPSIVRDLTRRRRHPWPHLGRDEKHSHFRKPLGARNAGRQAWMYLVGRRRASGHGPFHCRAREGRSTRVTRLSCRVVCVYVCVWTNPPNNALATTPSSSSFLHFSHCSLTVHHPALRALFLHVKPSSLERPRTSKHGTIRIRLREDRAERACCSFVVRLAACKPPSPPIPQSLFLKKSFMRKDTGSRVVIRQQHWHLRSIHNTDGCALGEGPKLLSIGTTGQCGRRTPFRLG